MKLKILIAAALVALAGCRTGAGQGGPSADAAAELRAAADDAPSSPASTRRAAGAPAWTGEDAAGARRGDRRGRAARARSGLAAAADRQRRLAGGARRRADPAALAYAEALARGRTDPARLRDSTTIPRPNPDLAAGLARALDGGDLRAWLAGLAPQDAEYRALSGAYLEARRQIAAAQRAAGARAARRRAARSPSISSAAAGSSASRRRPGSTSTPARRCSSTVRDDRVADTPPGRRRRARQGDARASPRRSSASSPTRPGRCRARSSEEEIAPKGAAYMARNNMEWRDGQIVQPSGPRNSLGLVKFDMRNDHAIYLHDTPAKALFGADERHRQPRLRAGPGRARLRPADRPRRGRARAMGARPAPRAGRGGRGAICRARRRAAARDPGPPALSHRPVENGRVVIVRDVYGWDDAVARALGLPAGAAPRRPRPLERRSRPLTSSLRRCRRRRYSEREPSRSSWRSSSCIHSNRLGDDNEDSHDRDRAA